MWAGVRKRCWNLGHSFVSNRDYREEALQLPYLGLPKNMPLYFLKQMMNAAKNLNMSFYSQSSGQKANECCQRQLFRNHESSPQNPEVDLRTVRLHKTGLFPPVSQALKEGGDRDRHYNFEISLQSQIGNYLV